MIPTSRLNCCISLFVFAEGIAGTIKEETDEKVKVALSTKPKVVMLSKHDVVYLNAAMVAKGTRDGESRAAPDLMEVHP